MGVSWCQRRNEMQGGKPEWGRERERQIGGERGCKVHDGDGGRHYKSFIFGSKAADAGMRVNVYRVCEKVMRTISDTDTFFKMAASLSPTGLSSQAPTYWCSATDRDLNILPLNLQQREWRAIEKKKKSDKEKLKSFFLYIGSACEWAMCCELMVVIIWVSL